MVAMPALSRVYWKLESLIDPGVVSSQYKYRDLVDAYVTPETAWLDIGCGHSLFPSWIGGQPELASRPRLIAGIDYTVSALTPHSTVTRLAVGDALALPFASGSFTLITANMVVEHLEDPIAALTEIRRVLAPGGHFIFHTPNLWFYQIRLAGLVPDAVKQTLVTFSEHRGEADIFRTFYRMNTDRDIRRAASRSGFALTRLGKLNTSSTGEIYLLGPFVVGALLVRRLLRMKLLENFRSNFIAVLQKPAGRGAPA